MKISIVLPVHNEEKNLPILYKEIDSVLQPLQVEYEVIWTDDGSKDRSRELIKSFTEKNRRHKAILLTRNFGQTAALSAGIMAAKGNIIIPLDADLQNDPADIPKFIAKIEEGYDVVSGWRKNRQDKALSRKLPSRMANILIGAITGVRIHDYGCSMKAYKRDLIQGVTLYGEMHRFIPAYAHWQGGTVTEIVVNHRPRIHGKTHYGIARTFKVLLDLVVLKFLTTYMNRPMHFFGGLGFLSLALGGGVALWALYLKLFLEVSLSRTPLPTISAMLVVVAVQLIVMGVIAEMLMRVYYETQRKLPYTVKEQINFE